MASGSYYNRYPIRCRTCFRKVDNKARNVELMLARYTTPTHDVLVQAMDDCGLELYCCRRYILAPEIVYYDMENRPVIEGVRRASEAVAMEARQRLEGDFIFGICKPSMGEGTATSPMLTSNIFPNVTPTPISVIPTMSKIIPQPLLSIQGMAAAPIPISAATSSAVPQPVQILQGLQSGINVGAAGVNQPPIAPVLIPLTEPIGAKPFEVPTEIGIPTYNPPQQEYKKVMVAVGARHHSEVLSGITFLAV